MDINSIRPINGWVLIKVDPAPEMQGALYIPAGNLEERLGQATGTVLKAGPGEWSSKGSRSPHGLKPGDRVAFRGYLSEINRPLGIMDREHCLVHIRDISLVLEE